MNACKFTNCFVYLCCQHDMNMLSTIIIDDENDCIDDLLYLIDKHQLPLQIAAKANSAEAGLAAILRHKPQLVILDVQMPGMTGFDLLSLLPKLDFQLIITTSYDHYAIQAIRASALDFLLKPVKASEFTNAIARCLEKIELPEKAQINLFQEMIHERSNPLHKIAIHNSEGVELVNVDEIIYLESEGNYSTLFMTGERKILATKPIGKFEEIFDGGRFFRIHNSFLVNLNYIQKFVKGDGGYVVLQNGKSIAVARRKKEEFLELLSKIG